MTDQHDDPFDGTDTPPVSDGGTVTAPVPRRRRWLRAVGAISVPTIAGFTPIALWQLAGFEAAVMLSIAGLTAAITSVTLGIGDA